MDRALFQWKKQISNIAWNQCNIQSWAIPGNLPSTLIKIQILENFCSIICYEFLMLKNDMQHRAGYPAD